MRHKKECMSCETKFTITVTESNFELLPDVTINYCPHCSAEFEDLEDYLEDY